MGSGLQALAPLGTLQTPYVQEELSGLVSKAPGLQLFRVPKAQRKQLEMLLEHELGWGEGGQREMAREVLTAGGDGGFAKRTFSGDWVSEQRRVGKAWLRGSQQ